MKYQKTQYSWIPILFILMLVFINYAYFNNMGTKPIPLLPTVLLTVFFVLLSLTFYKLTISITAIEITAKFGIGLLKRRMLLQDIKTIELVKIPWYYGIGIRATPYGLLYNIRTGKAILLQNSNKTKTFLVGTADFENIKNILEKPKQ